jgi:hypothetical protein
MRDHPLDPKVGFEASMRTDVSTTERRQWLDRFKQGSPDNALADYLSASEHFRTGRVEDAFQDLAAASGKRKFQDYTLERIQDGEEALRSAGYPAAEANLLANHQMQLPQLVEARQLAGTLVDLAGSYRQSGDETSRQSVLSMALDLGRRFGEAQPGNLTIAQLVGFQIESQALGAMDPAAASGIGGLTVQNRIQQLGQQQEAMLDRARQTNPLWAGLSEQDWISYQQRSATFGEDASKRWLVQKFGAK